MKFGLITRMKGSGTSPYNPSKYFPIREKVLAIIAQVSLEG
jgi:hypothetical protein